MRVAHFMLPAFLLAACAENAGGGGYKADRL